MRQVYDSITKDTINMICERARKAQAVQRGFQSVHHSPCILEFRLVSLNSRAKRVVIAYAASFHLSGGTQKRISSPIVRPKSVQSLLGTLNKDK
jgi:hypothetical protein